MNGTPILCAFTVVATLLMPQLSGGIEFQGNTACSVCKWLVTEIEKAINFGHNEKQILLALTEVGSSKIVKLVKNSYVYLQLFIVKYIINLNILGV